MEEETAEKLRFRPRARIIRTIGDQLISGPEAAVIELVKNAYDADARKVTLAFIPPLEPGEGRIVVEDDGHGMTLADMRDKWMEPATTSKVAGRRSPLLGRVMMGFKGIGRFAAAKLGGRMALNSISDRDGERREVLIPDIDWSIFDGETYLSDIAIEFHEQFTTESTGTIIEITGLNEAWPQTKMNRLILELRRLLSPLDSNGGEDEFKIFLDLSACTQETAGFDGVALLRATNGSPADAVVDEHPNRVLPFPLLTACDYEVQGEFDSSGGFIGTFRNRRAGTGAEDVILNIPYEEEEESCGPVGVKLFLFDREADAIKSNMRQAGLGDLSAAQARRMLDATAGVAIYRSGFRVRPYGDAANDWLTLDRRRVQNPSMRIGHNQIAGYITVADQAESGLEERSSREGFEQNGAFIRLANLVETVLREVAEPKRYQFRVKAGIARNREVTYQEVRQLSELAKVRLLVASLEPQERAKAEQLIDSQTALLSNRIDQLEERQRVLEAKSSLGAIISEVLHEGAQPAGYIESTAPRLTSRINDLLGVRGPRFEAAEREFRSKLPMIASEGTKLANLFRNLKPLAGGRRGLVQSFPAVNVINSSRELFSGHTVPVKLDNQAGSVDLIGYPDDLSTALVNLIGNALHWIEGDDVANPLVTITLQATSQEAIIFVDDNGPGVTEEFADSIFDVGFSLKPDGTGLGLNIAKEALARSGATLAYHMDFTEGARFEIRFPRVQEAA